MIWLWIACGLAICAVAFADAFFRERRRHGVTTTRLTDAESERVRLANTLRETCLDRDALKKTVAELRKRGARWSRDPR